MTVPTPQPARSLWRIPLVALYRPTDWVGRMICWQTRSRYSHAAIVIRDYLDGDLDLVEAWHRPILRGGAVREGRASDLHPGQSPELFGVWDIHEIQLAEARRLARCYLGMPYDFRGVLRFVSRKAYPANRRWFCSELVADCLRAAGCPLLHAEPHLVSPGVLSWSPLLVPISAHLSTEHTEGTEGERNTRTLPGASPSVGADTSRPGPRQPLPAPGSLAAPSVPSVCSVDHFPHETTGQVPAEVSPQDKGPLASAGCIQRRLPPTTTAPAPGSEATVPVPLSTYSPPAGRPARRAAPAARVPAGSSPAYPQLSAFIPHPSLRSLP